MIELVLAKGNVPDASSRRCSDCAHCKAAVTWWCTNMKAVAERGTNIPGNSGCPHWSPCRIEEQLSFVEKYLAWSDYVIVEPVGRIEP